MYVNQPHVLLESVKLMSKIKGFYDSLKKSTKITVLSCGSFVIMTMLILAFFIIFPITPSERIMSNIGRGENLSQDNGQPLQSAIPEVETTVSTTVTTTKATTTKVTTTRARTSFTITLTTGSGFMWNGRIPTGGIPGYTETYTTAVDPSEPYIDPSNPNGDPNQGGTTDPNQGGTDPNQGGSTDPNQGGATDPNQGGTPDPNQGVVTPDPNQGGTPEPSVTPDAGGNNNTW